MEIIDGVGGKPHVTAEQIGLSNVGVFGDTAYILPVGNMLGYNIVSANTIGIKDGIFILQGRRGCIEPGNVETCAIDTGTQNKRRHDLICIKYAKNPESKIESMMLEVVKGQEGAVGVDPTYSTGNINTGALLHYEPLYRVRLNGINIEGVDRLIRDYNSGEMLLEKINIIINTLRESVLGV